MNPIDLEIYWNRLISITDEAGAALKRTSFSTIVREATDFACVLLDTEARLVARLCGVVTWEELMARYKQARLVTQRSLRNALSQPGR